MNRAFLLAACGALLLGAPAAPRAQAPATPTTTMAPEPTGPPPQEVVSGGTLPDDLLGRWIVVGWIGIRENDQGKTTTALWDITREDAQLVFRQLYRELPERVS